MGAKKVTPVDINDLVDIQDVEIDLSLPVEEKIKSFKEQIKNPYLYRCDDTIIRISYAKTDVKLKDKVINYLLSEQKLSLR
ncbi:MAG: hypothetical protein FWC91_07765 [Defluviitaleaceae bacterium]|nr:hypothetical protein [Defluviitaleaceae bacterium]